MARKPQQRENDSQEFPPFEPKDEAMLASPPKSYTNSLKDACFHVLRAVADAVKGIVWMK